MEETQSTSLKRIGSYFISSSDKLGEGHYGKVFQGYFRKCNGELDTSKPLACKIVNRE